MKLSKDKTLHSAQTQPVNTVMAETDIVCNKDPVPDSDARPELNKRTSPVLVSEGSSTSPTKSQDTSDVIDISQDSGIESPDRGAASTNFREGMLDM